MEAGITPEQRETEIEARDSDPVLAQLVPGMVDAVQTGELAAKSNGALERASNTLPEPKTVATPTGARADLPDTREGFGPHRTYQFTVTPSEGTVYDELTRLLGKRAADGLVWQWDDACNLKQKLGATKIALFLDSNNKAPSRDYAPSDAKTTQEEDFTATNHQFAADLAATLFCARIVKKVQDSEPLSEGEKVVYEKLKVGILRCCSGALVVGRLFPGLNADSGRDYFLFRDRPDVWALGSPLSPELK